MSQWIDFGQPWDEPYLYWVDGKVTEDSGIDTHVPFPQEVADARTRAKFGATEDETELALTAVTYGDPIETETLIGLSGDKLHLLLHDMYQDRETFPEVLAWRAEKERLEALQSALLVPSFVSMDLNKPGTWVQMENGKVFLLGDVSIAGVLRGDDNLIEDYDIVVRYFPPADPPPPPPA